MSKQNIRKRPLIIAISLILVLLILFSGYKIADTLIFDKDQGDTDVVSTKTVMYNGKEYYPRQDITVFMLLGIDQKGPKVDSGSYNNEGQADLITLAVFDEADKSYSILLLNRDTMTQIPVLGLGGKEAGTINAQLALAHNQGSGLEDSCENMRKAVANLLGVEAVDYYFSMNLDAISILNDAVGGVKVNVTDDFSNIDSTIPKGEVLLNGKQALSFVQTRKNVGDQMNISRMERHKEYMDGFTKAFDNKLQESDGFILKTYDEIAEYVISDCSANTLSSVLDRYSDYELREIISPEGENKKGTKYMEFYPDEDKLEDLVIKLFYSEKK